MDWVQISFEYREHGRQRTNHGGLHDSFLPSEPYSSNSIWFFFCNIDRWTKRCGMCWTVTLLNDQNVPLVGDGITVPPGMVQISTVPINNYPTSIWKTIGTIYRRWKMDSMHEMCGSERREKILPLAARWNQSGITHTTEIAHLLSSTSWLFACHNKLPSTGRRAHVHSKTQCV